MSAAAYIIGRQVAALSHALTQPAIRVDRLFAAERIDGSRISSIKFEHCTFANISFKGCVIDNAAFHNCVFIGCYFRLARIEDSKFEACRFIECDFTKLDIRTCDLKFYNRFSGCWISRNELEHTLPQAPNLRHHLCVNMAREARVSGATREAEWYQQEAASANEKHLLSAFLHKSNYYREKFRGALRVSALAQYLGSKGRGYIWGYKRSFLVVARNWAIATLILFPVLFGLGLPGLDKPGGVSWADAWLASLTVTIPVPAVPDIRFTSGYSQAVAFVEAVLALLFAGLVVALLFRAVFDRWR